MKRAESYLYQPEIRKKRFTVRGVFVAFVIGMLISITIFLTRGYLYDWFKILFNF